MSEVPRDSGRENGEGTSSFSWKGIVAILTPVTASTAMLLTQAGALTAVPVPKNLEEHERDRTPEVSIRHSFERSPKGMIFVLQLKHLRGHPLVSADMHKIEYVSPKGDVQLVQHRSSHVEPLSRVHILLPENVKGGRVQFQLKMHHVSKFLEPMEIDDPEKPRTVKTSAGTFSHNSLMMIPGGSALTYGIHAPPMWNRGDIRLAVYDNALGALLEKGITVTARNDKGHALEQLPVPARPKKMDGPIVVGDVEMDRRSVRFKGVAKTITYSGIPDQITTIVRDLELPLPKE